MNESRVIPGPAAQAQVQPQDLVEGLAKGLLPDAALVDRRDRCHGAIGMAVSSSTWSRSDIEARLVPPLLATVAKLRAIL